MLSAVQYSHQLLDHLFERFPTGTYVDATLGNGNDFLYMLKQPNFAGKCLGFDIQQLAIDASTKKIKEWDASRNASLPTYEIIKDSHAQVDQYLTSEERIHGAIFNLGYLPGSDHSITTHFESTYQAIKKISNRLVVGGQIILVIYWGHEAGQVEKSKLMEQLVQWPQRHWQVLKYQFINQINHPPFVVVLEKI